MKLSIFSAVALFIALLVVTTVVIGVTQPALAEETPDNNSQGVSTSTATSTPTKKPSVAVRDVTVSSNADGSAVVSWKKSVRKKGADRAAKCASAKLREYRYKVVDTSNPTRVEIARGKATSNSETVTGLTAGNQYQVLVWSRSADGCDNGKWSNFRRATWTQAGG